jgi:uncharacterized protein YgbK (DUF1537 family)
MIAGVVADDITGSNDIGVMFTKSGCPSSVYTLPGSGDLKDMELRVGPWQVGIINTNSRLDCAEMAYRKVFNATRYLESKNCRRFFKKTCSVFRGNIGAEFDAMLDALGLEFGVVVLGFPKNGRTTIGGMHQVRGLPLEQSEFRHDPIHPLLSSDLKEILSAQSRRKVGNIFHPVIELGSDAVRDAIDSLRTRCGYVVMDVVDQHSLKIIAEAVQDEPVLCGSSALAEELPVVWGASPPFRRSTGLSKKEGCGILCVVGSLMPQSRRQAQLLSESGTPAFELDGKKLFDDLQRENMKENLSKRITGVMASGQDALLHSSSDLALVDLTKKRGRSKGLSDTKIARLVSETLADISAQVLRETGQNRMVAAGGETSDAVCSRLGVKGLEIWEEIQPGLPSCLTIPGKRAAQTLLLVLKSGSFGNDDFLVEALDHLRSLN